MNTLRTALAGGGLLLAGLSFVVGNFAGEQIEPVENVIEPVFVPAASLCPFGWADVSDTAPDHAVLSCEREVDGVKWLVVIDPLTELGERGLALDTPGAQWIPASEVPGWP